MPLTVDLPDDLADALTAEASRLGLSLHDYAESRPANGGIVLSNWEI